MATIDIQHTFDANNTPPVVFESGSKTYAGKHFVDKNQMFSNELSNDYIYLWTYEGVEKFNIHTQKKLHVATDTPFTFVMNGSFVKVSPLKNGEEYKIKIHQFSAISPASAFKFFPSFEKLNKEGPQIKYSDYFRADTIVRGITAFSLNRVDGYWDFFVKIPAVSSLGSVVPTYHIKKGLIFDSNLKWSPNVGGRLVSAADESDKAASPEIQFEKDLTQDEKLVLPIRTDGSSYIVEVNGTKVYLNLAETFADSETFDLHLGRVSIVNEPSRVLSFDLYGLDRYKEDRTMLLASKLAPTDSISVLPGNYEVLTREKIIGAPEREYSLRQDSYLLY